MIINRDKESNIEKVFSALAIIKDYIYSRSLLLDSDKCNNKNSIQISVYNYVCVCVCACDHLRTSLHLSLLRFVIVNLCMLVYLFDFSTFDISISKYEIRYKKKYMNK